MTRKSEPERMLTEDERALLEHWPAVDPANAPIEELPGGGFTWSFRSIRSPTSYGSRELALERFTQFHGMLQESARVERERTYAVRPDDERR